MAPEDITTELAFIGKPGKDTNVSLRKCFKQALKAAETQSEGGYITNNLRAVELKDGVLKSSGVNPATIFFSDRPERIVRHEPTEVFVDQWGVGENSFAVNSTNTALSILAGPEPQEIILELMNPRLDENNLSYDVKVLDRKDAVSGDAVSLFIDPVGRPLSPASVAGMHRGRRRRMVRRATR